MAFRLPWLVEPYYYGVGISAVAGDGAQVGGDVVRGYFVLLTEVENCGAGFAGLGIGDLSFVSGSGDFDFFFQVVDLVFLRMAGDVDAAGLQGFDQVLTDLGGVFADAVRIFFDGVGALRGGQVGLYGERGADTLVAFGFVSPVLMTDHVFRVVVDLGRRLASILAGYAELAFIDEAHVGIVAVFRLGLERNPVLLWFQGFFEFVVLTMAFG